MTYRLPNLTRLRAFEAAARLGSFTAAAGELCLTQAAVSHQVRSLESTLGFALFVRHARTLELSEMGRAYIPSVRKAIEELAFSTQGLFGPKLHKAVTIQAPISTAVLWLAPRLKLFRQGHPEIDLRMISAIWADAIADEDVDIDIRLGNGAWAGFHAELLSSETAVPVCAPDLAPEIGSVSDLRGRELIHILGYQDLWARFFKAAGEDYGKHSLGISVDTTLAAIEIVSACGGVALITKRFASGLVESGRVAVPFVGDIPLGQSHYIVTIADSRPSAAAALLRQWVQSAFAAPVALASA